MTAPPVPEAWSWILAGESGESSGPGDTGGPGGRVDPGNPAGRYAEAWRSACGSVSGPWRGYARWCRERAAELAGLADEGPALIAALHRGLGAASGPEAVRSAMRAVSGQAGRLEDAARLLDDAADAVDSVRVRHAEALDVLDAEGAAGAVGTPAGAPSMPGGLSELREAFVRSCGATEHAMARLSEALEEGLRAIAAEDQSGGALRV